MVLTCFDAIYLVDFLQFPFRLLYKQLFSYLPSNYMYHYNNSKKFLNICSGPKSAYAQYKSYYYLLTRFLMAATTSTTRTNPVLLIIEFIKKSIYTTRIANSL